MSVSRERGPARAPGEPEASENLLDLCRRMAESLRRSREEAEARQEIVAPAERVVRLRASDLATDPDGAVALFNDSDYAVVEVAAGQPVVAKGRSAPQRLQDGTDVTGWRYVAFADGLRLYYQDGYDLVVTY